jgi:hypothetical protein
MNENNITGFYWEQYGKFGACLECAFAVFIMFSGVGINALTIMNYISIAALNNLKKKAHLSVLKTPPNKLILVYLRNTEVS